MRSHSYEVQKGNEVKPQHVGKTVSWQKAQTIGEALGLDAAAAEKISAIIGGAAKSVNPHFESELALVSAGEQQRDIAVRDDIRGVLGTDEGTIDAAAKLANELTIGAPRSGTGRVGRAVKPETKQRNVAAGLGNKIFERALVDEKFRATMAKNDMLAGFDEWQAARAAATPQAPAQG